MKDGVHDIPFEQYRVEPGLNQSALKRMARSPAHFRHYVDNPQEPTRAQILGTVLHTAVLTPDLLEGSYFLRPETYTGAKGEQKPWNGNATECRTWLAAHTGKPVLKRDDNDIVLTMRHYVLDHPAVKIALATGAAEQSLFATDPETGVKLKARSDWLSGVAVVELKSCQDASPAGFAKAIVNFGYDIQRAMTLFICDLLGLQKSEWVFIAVESEAPFAVACYSLTDMAGIGQSKFRRLLNRYAECEKENRWRAYSPNIEYLELPKWAASVEMNAMILEDSPAIPALIIE